MRRFTTLEAIAAALPIDNVDTDKILPGEFLKTVTRTGLGQALFARMRYREDGSEIENFVLNRAPWRDAGILIAGANFGCGSSREHAPWALLDFGITCIIARSFADIFHNNCFKNGILPIALEPETVEGLLRRATQPDTARLKVDLPRQIVVTSDGGEIGFEIGVGGKATLIAGYDEIEQTLLHANEIAAWEARNARDIPVVAHSEI